MNTSQHGTLDTVAVVRDSVVKRIGTVL